MAQQLLSIAVCLDSSSFAMHCALIFFFRPQLLAK
jgi:hypothetical protein